MPDEQWIDLAHLEKFYDFDADKLLEKIRNGEVDHRFIGGDEAKHLQLKKLDIEKYFHKLTTPKQTVSERRLESTVFTLLGAGAGIVLGNLQSTPGTPPNDKNSPEQSYHWDASNCNGLQEIIELNDQKLDDLLRYSNSYIVGFYELFVRLSIRSPDFREFTKTILSLKPHVESESYFPDRKIGSFTVNKALRSQPINTLSAISLANALYRYYQYNFDEIQQRNGLSSPKEIFERLHVRPAVWTILDFDEIIGPIFENPSIYRRILDASGQTNLALLEDIANGLGITKITAILLCREISDIFGYTASPVLVNEGNRRVVRRIRPSRSEKILPMRFSPSL